MISIREAFGRELVEIGKKNKKVVVVSCDLKGATKTNYFFEKFPERSFEVGIAEANGIGIAAGLAMSDLRPVISSFSAFLVGKNVELRNSIAYNNANVVVVGTHGGMIGPDGATQSGIQDLAIMRSIPNFKVFQPSTPILTKKIINYCINLNSPSYLRISRNEIKEFYSESIEFKEGDPITVLEPKEVNIISSGPMMQNCLEAAKRLNENNKIEIGLIDLPTLKPLNFKKLEEILKNSKYIFTIEDHVIQGGIGGLVSEYLSSSNINAKLFIKGLENFVSSGTPHELEIKYGLDKDSICEFILSKI